jgi:predicted lipoprotein with Yx(FWY)xxD motif
VDAPVGPAPLPKDDIMRRTILITAAAAGALTLAGCGTGGLYGGSSSAGSGSSSAGTSSSAAAAASELAATKTSLGTVLVDGKGRTVYAFDKDTPGSSTSACTGTCVGLWPALTTTSSTPSVTGVSGTVSTLPTADGGKQVAIDGHRLYTFSGDSQAGQVNGQGFMGLWWTVSPAGQQIKGSAGAASSSSSSAPGYTY